MHILVTLLGKVKDPKFSNYQEANYLFDNGNKYTSRFFGLTLQKEQKPDKLVVLGTSGSMWDNLMREAGVDDESVKALDNLSQTSSVDESVLRDYVPALERHIGIPCHLEIIPYGRNADEQTQILHSLMKNFAENDEATLDVTHGFRHLPMLVQQSALLLQTLKSVKINGIFYGAWDMRDENDISPVMRLDGLIDVERWTKALYRYEQDGDYAAFRKPLKASGAAEATLKSLDAAAYFERTFNLTKAGIELKKVKQALEATNQSGISSFFTGSLLKHISWSDSVSLQQRQANLAHFYLERGDFVRASIFAMESFITSLLKHNEKNQQQNFRVRSKATKDFKNAYDQKVNSDRGNTSLFPIYEELSKIRNALAHGTEPSNAIAHLMENQQKIETTLKRLFDELGVQKSHSAQA